MRSSSSSSLLPSSSTAAATEEHAPATEDGGPLPSTPPPRSRERERLHSSFRDDRHYLRQMVALDRNKRSDRIDAILELKGSIEKSATTIQSRNAKHDRRHQEIQAEDTRRFQELLNQGKNPYEVARTRTVREIAEKERTQIEHRIQDKQVSILKHLEVEKVWMQRQQRVAQEQQAYEKKYQKELGRAAEEERTRQYLVARTTGGRETMDPTGKAVRLYPSQETTIKDRSFGLGKNLAHDADQRRQIVDRVHRKRAHRDAPGATPSKMLLPRVGEKTSTATTTTATTHSNNNAVDAATAAVEAASTPGQELRGLNHSIVDHDGRRAATVSLPPVAGRRTSATTRRGVGSSEETTTTKKKGFGKPHRSVLEQRMLEQARERQKTNIFQKQVVWGKEFTGRAFLADPEAIWFKDFDVGVPMTRQFTLTNVSNTFNHFKLLDLDEAIKECFAIQFDKPGRMSAGMACRITVVFTAKEARDIDSFVPAIAQTGPFAIPLKCTCKKAVPVMETRALVFKNVVAGEKQVLTLQLENQGALPLAFRVRRVETATTTTASSRLAGPEQDVDGGHEGNAGGDVGRVEDELDKEGEGEEEENADMERRQEELLMQDGAVSSVEEPPTFGLDSVSNEDGGAIAGSAVPDDGDSEAIGDERSLSRDPSVEGTSLSSSCSGASLGSVASSRVPLSADEQNILETAQAATMYRPDGADTPIRHTTKGTVPPYSSSAVSFTFAPSTAPLQIDNQAFLIEFPEATTTHRKALSGGQLLAPLHVCVSAGASHVPIFVEQSVLDLRCCLYDRLYRSQLVVCNRGSIALKMQIRVPKALEDCVECTPNMGFVQGVASATGHAPSDHAHAGKFSVQIKFRPHCEMWRRLETKGFGSAALGFLAVPIQVVVPDQVVPVFFLLMARISSAALAFSRTKLNFGACVLGHSVAHTLEITNSSRLPQRLAFVKLPVEIRLENPAPHSADPADDGMATLLPHETKRFRVVYLPNASATTLSGKLVCKTTTNDEYGISLVGECVATPLVFSHSVLQLGATQLGQKATHSVACTNTSDKPQLLELVVPVEAGNMLHVTPTVATLAPRSSIRIEVEFAPQQAIYELPPSEFASRENQESVDDHRTMTAAAQSVTVNTSRLEPTRLALSTRSALLQTANGSLPSWVETGGVAAEPRSVHHTWSVLCFRATRQAGTSAPQLVAFQVRTTAVDATLFATPTDLAFGQVAIGQTLVRELVFTNNSAHNVQLCAKPLHALGGFRMINSVQRGIRAHGGQRVVKIEFQPTTPLLYEDELELSCPEMGVVRVALSGEGVNPSLCISPVDGVIDFKDVLARNRATSELQLTNASAFPLTLSIVPLLEGIHKELLAVTSSGLPVFTFAPSVATIPAQATLSVKVMFFPDHQRPHHYHEKFLIQVPNESERHVLSLTGRCWENQLYVFNPQEPPKLFAAPPVEDLFDVPPSINLASLLAGNTAAASNGSMASLFTLSLAVPGIKKAATPLTVVFDGERAMGEEALVAETKTIFIGGTLPPSTSDDDASGSSSTSTTTQKSGGSVGSFEFVIEENAEKPQFAKMFTLEPMKGSVTAGQQLPIQLSYQPPTAAVDASGSDRGDGGAEPPAHPELVVSQWIQVRVSCTLKGGALWRPLPSAGGGSSTTPAATGGGKGGGGGAQSATSGESDTRVVRLVLRAKMHT